MRIDEEYKLSKTIDLELTRAEVEVLELEARLRVVPMNDTQLSDALKTALAAKKDRLAKLRTLRSEEHTSELQSQSNLVCRLLLEKKNRHTIMLMRVQRDTLPPVQQQVLFAPSGACCKATVRLLGKLRFFRATPCRLLYVSSLQST